MSNTSATSLAKLTSLSTQTLSLILERQRLKTIASTSESNSLHQTQIVKNLGQLRRGIQELASRSFNDRRATEAVGLLRNQYERMEGMLGQDAVKLGVESLAPLVSNSRTKDLDPIYTPYTDHPEGEHDTGAMLQTQQRMMDDQDQVLSRLSHSVNRQRDISLQINDELEVHGGLLEELDTDVDNTSSRLGHARRRLNYFAKGAKENVSAVTIGLLIFVLLVLIILFKT